MSIFNKCKRRLFGQMVQTYTIRICLKKNKTIYKRQGYTRDIFNMANFLNKKQQYSVQMQGEKII